MVQPYKCFFLKLPIQDIQEDYRQLIRRKYSITMLFSSWYKWRDMFPKYLLQSWLLMDCMRRDRPYPLIQVLHQFLIRFMALLFLSQEDVVMFLTFFYRIRFQCTDSELELTLTKPLWMRKVASSWMVWYTENMRQWWRFHWVHWV